MKITLDHNCLIDLSNDTAVGKQVRKIIDSKASECFIVNIGASEFRKKGIKPDRYDLFEQFLKDVSLEKLHRINPVGVYGVTFMGFCVYSNKEVDAELKKVWDILFPNRLQLDNQTEGFDSNKGRKVLNQICDVHGMYSHIKSQNDIFLSSDKNFHKDTKKHKLKELGAKDIKQPFELVL